jgi:hypothetical protein
MLPVASTPRRYTKPMNVRGVDVTDETTMMAPVNRSTSDVSDL